MSDSPLSHREAKKRRTRAALESEATKQVLARGSANVTIEDICEPVGISKRTFFNYFSSKEEAIIGAGPRIPTDDEVQAFIAKPHDDILGSTMRFFHSLISHQSHIFDWDTLKRRHEIKQREPELGAHQFANFHVARHQVEQLLIQYYTAFPQQVVGHHTAEEEAGLVTGIAIMCLANAGRRWEAEGDGSADSLIEFGFEVREEMRRVLAAGATTQ